ncbi:MAG: UDP-2,4-diacetamido-2,4,6-trideoxy-beta-L-altropyranose hydrolase [Terriglobales bacterium]
MEKPGHLIIGADCGIQTGTGHVMRCLALAQSWYGAGGSVTFFLPEGSPGIEQRIRSEGFLLEPLASAQFADTVVNRIVQSKPQVAVVDGYDFGSTELAALGFADIAVLAVDDYGHASEYPVRWILNQNLAARPDLYARRARGTRLLLGSSYALLRDEFLAWLGWKRAIPEKACKILVTIGGSDPDNLSLRILESFAALGSENLDVVLVIGSGNPHLYSVQSTIAKLPVRVRLVENSSDMPALMAWADIAISGAGGTAYELCYMGLPSLLFVIAQNQCGVARHLSQSSAALHAGRASEFDSQRFVEQLRTLIDAPQMRQNISNRARDLVDGLGADRVRAALRDRDLKIRPLSQKDCQLLFTWANDPVVRAASFHSAPVLREGHQEWFAQKLQDPQSVIYIGETCAGDAVGQVRFHLEGDRATLSIVIAAEFRGAGWGKELIAFSIRMLARSHSCRRIDAFVKPENKSSIRLFESSGFRRVGIEQIAGQPALLFAWMCGSDIHAN